MRLLLLIRARYCAWCRARSIRSGCAILATHDGRVKERRPRTCFVLTEKSTATMISTLWQRNRIPLKGWGSGSCKFFLVLAYGIPKPFGTLVLQQHGSDAPTTIASLKKDRATNSAVGTRRRTYGHWVLCSLVWWPRHGSRARQW